VQVPPYTVHRTDDGIRKRLVVEVSLPGILTGSGLEVSVREHEASLFVRAPGRYKLTVPLGVPVSGVAEAVKFVRNKSVLKVGIRLRTPLHEAQLPASFLQRPHVSPSLCGRRRLYSCAIRRSTQLPSMIVRHLMAHYATAARLSQAGCSMAVDAAAMTLSLGHRPSSGVPMACRMLRRHLHRLARPQHTAHGKVCFSGNKLCSADASATFAVP